MIDKFILPNLIRDEMSRVMWGGGLGIGREKDPVYRPVILIEPIPMCRQSIWQHFNRVIIDFVVVSPFRLGTGSQSSTNNTPNTNIGIDRH